MLRGLAVAVAALALMVAAGLGASTARAHSAPCHRAHTCPSDHHTYAWKGLWCTSYANEKRKNDTIRVRNGGRTYWCHRR